MYDYIFWNLFEPKIKNKNKIIKIKFIDVFKLFNKGIKIIKNIFRIINKMYLILLLILIKQFKQDLSAYKEIDKY